MKKTILISLAFLPFVACQQKTESVTINGKIANPQEGKMIYLARLTNEGSEIKDSTKTDKEGNFSLTVKNTEPNFYGVNIYGIQQGQFILNDSPITIEAAGSQNGNFKVIGSTDNDLLEEYNKFAKDISEKIQTYERAYETTDDEQFRKETKEKYDALVSESTENLKKLIEKAGTSFAVFPMLQYIDIEKDFVFLDKTHQKFNAQYPQSPYVLAFGKALDAHRKTAIGQTAPEFSLKSPEGKQLSLASLKGKYVLIDFWASWCGPCRQENPNVVKVYADFKDKGFEILGVSLDRDQKAWTEAISADKLAWSHVWDENNTVSTLYNVSGIPMTYLLDKDGKIIAKNLRGEQLRKELEKLMVQ